MTHSPSPRSLRACLAAGAVGTAIFAAAAPVNAQRYERGAPDYVTAESHWGNGTVSGPVRPGRNGWQVRLPGGTWIDCRRSCADTLRRQTVDFWQSNGPQSRNDGPNYFRWERRF